jgi:hypothetical protein
MDTAWAVVTDGEGGAPIAPDLLAKCMSAIPNSDQFSTPSADYAQNLAIMVAHVVEFMVDNNVKYVVLTATLARDLVDAKVQINEELNASDPRLEQKIAEHPLMRAELEAQRRSLATLGHLKAPDELRAFRRAAAGSRPAF